MKVSKRAIWMWAVNRLLKPVGLTVSISWFIIGDLYLYMAPQKNLGNLLESMVFLEKWLFLGLSVILAFLIFSATSGAFYKYWSISYELEDIALKIIKGFYQKQESYIPYKNIQNIDIKMSAGERFWGLATILIYTSAVGDKTNPGLAEGYIEGVRYNNAVALKDELLKRIK